MGQYFVLFNIDRLEYISYDHKFGEVIFDGSFTSILQWLVKPIGYKPRPLNLMGGTRKVSDDERKISPEMDPSPLRNALGQLAKFPDEILCMVFDNVDTLEDVVRLGFANRYLYNIAYNVVQQRYLQCRAAWAGCRLLCLGDYAESRDLPPGAFTKDEEQEIQEYCDTVDNASPYQYFTKFCDLREPSMPRVEFSIIYDLLDCSDQNGAYSTRMKNYFWAIEHPALMYGTDQLWALCNLSKNEYVRLDAVDAVLGYKAGHPLSLQDMCFSVAQVLACRICWSSEPSFALCYTELNHKGIWAGDRFEITTLDRMEPPKDGKIWKDVSDDAINEAIELWKADYGDEWEERIGDRLNRHSLKMREYNMNMIRQRWP
ncbi:unnamed protein product [Somion occarium]|uniref:F-box domain-containing protein n=1 Tax=Somion occarium TaxID=3059160 RepID=A0ABP1CR39_9APHY